MAVSQRSLARAAQLFHALSDETRLAIVRRLHDGERCVCDLTDLLDAAQSRLSFHLRVLKEAGLVTDRRDGRWVHYALEPHAFAEAEAMLAGLAPRARGRALPVTDAGPAARAARHGERTFAGTNGQGNGGRARRACCS